MIKTLSRIETDIERRLYEQFLCDNLYVTKNIFFRVDGTTIICQTVQSLKVVASCALLQI